MLVCTEYVCILVCMLSVVSVCMMKYINFGKRAPPNVFSLSFYLLIIFTIIYSMRCQKSVKNAYLNFPEQNMTF